MQSPSPGPDDLILEAAEGRRVLSDAELRRILEHVAAAGFDPNVLERVRGRVAGMIWRGRIVRGRDRLPPLEAKYIWHVVTLREWPEGTSIRDYVESLRGVILDPRSGAFTSRYLGTWQLGIVRESLELAGPARRPWILIEYRMEHGHWVTAFQPRRGLDHLDEPARSDLRWLRPPRSKSG